jgi:hypothetical protein
MLKDRTKLPTQIIVCAPLRRHRRSRSLVPTRSALAWIRNVEFIVPPKHWNKGSGSVLTKSYLHYAPKLGYRGSAFNLVYVNNIASVR